MSLSIFSLEDVARTGVGQLSGPHTAVPDVSTLALSLHICAQSLHFRDNVAKQRGGSGACDALVFGNAVLMRKPVSYVPPSPLVT